MTMKGCTHIYTYLGNCDYRLQSEIAEKCTERLGIHIHVYIYISEECVRKSNIATYVCMSELSSLRYGIIVLQQIGFLFDLAY